LASHRSRGAIGVVLGLFVGVLVAGRTDILDTASDSDDLSSGARVAVGPIGVVLEPRARQYTGVPSASPGLPAGSEAAPVKVPV
jgi:hypothetical protein